jgi:subtilisin family serine protease
MSNSELVTKKVFRRTPAGENPMTFRAFEVSNRLRFSRVTGVMLLILTPLLMAFYTIAPTTVAAQTVDPQVQIKATAEYFPGEVIVKFKPSTSGFYPDRYFGETTFSKYGLSRFEGVSQLRETVIYKASETANMYELSQLFAADPRVEFAEPNYIYHTFLKPNDTFYTQGRQYHIDKINMQEAWDVSTGNGKIVVAVVDTGIRNNYSDQLNANESCEFFVGVSYVLDTYGSYVPSSPCGPPVRDNPTTSNPEGPAPPLPTNAAGEGTVVSIDCFTPQPTPYPFSTTACPVAPLSGGSGVKDLKRKVLAQQGISTSPDCQYPLFDPRSPECTTDYNGHGTAVGGVITANSNDGYGAAGICWNCLLLPTKAFRYDGAAASSWVANSIVFAADNQARVINLSLGGPVKSQILENSVKYAVNKGAILVAASGNEGNATVNYPAGYEGVIAVGATDQNDRPARFSSYGPHVSVVAPGVDILTTNLNWPGTEFDKGTPGIYDDPNRPLADRGDFVIVDGTSFSTPIVSGIIALMLSVRPELTATQVKNLLEGTADDVDLKGRDDRTGFGRVNAGRALKATRDLNLGAGKSSVIRGFVSGANPPDVVMNLDPGGIAKNTDSSGNYAFETLGAGEYTLRAVIPRAQRILGPVIITLDGSAGNESLVNFDFANNRVILGPNARLASDVPPSPNPNPNPAPKPPPSQAQFFAPVPAVPSNATLTYFAETGHTLRGEFKRYWERNGGLAIFGYPLSEEFTEVSQTDGKSYLVQYFQRNRFEYHPENVNTPNVVLLGLLGSELTKGRNFPPAAPVPSTPNLIYFPETRHTLSGRFLQYWQQNGGLAIFGYPISEPIQENGLLVQYFQRNRFEYHPQNANSRFDVLLGLLGTDLARSNGYIQ